jgi:hypothetical protein
MMLPLLVVVLAGSLQPANAPDTFWVLAANHQKDDKPEPIRGALLGEDATHYHVRVEGGELWIEKALVQRVEKDELTAEAIQQKEQQKRDAAKAEPAPQPAAEATAAPSDATAKPAEAAATKKEAEATATPAEPDAAIAGIDDFGPRYDPVLHRMTGSAMASARERLEELRAAYRQTRSPMLRKELRRARRDR